MDHPSSDKQENEESKSPIVINIIPPSPQLESHNRSSGENNDEEEDCGTASEDDSIPMPSLSSSQIINTGTVEKVTTPSSSDVNTDSNKSIEPTPITNPTINRPNSIINSSSGSFNLQESIGFKDSYPSSPNNLIHNKVAFTNLDNKSALSRSSPNLQTLSQKANLKQSSATTNSTPQSVSPQSLSPPTASGNNATNPTTTTTTTTTAPTHTSPNKLKNSDNITLGSFAESQNFEDFHNTGNGQLVGGISPNRVGKIFDHFLVVGLPSTIKLTSTVHDERQTHRPQIIYQYPPDKSLPNDMIEQFCFPTGVESRSSQRSYSSSSLNQVSFSSLSNLLNPTHSNVFLITSLHTLYYGICIIKDEEVSSLPSFIDDRSPLNQCKYSKEDGEGKEKRRSLNRNQYDFIAPRVYCFLSRFPFFQLHFQMLHSILEGERMLMLFSLSQSTDPQNNGSSTLDLLDLYYNIGMESVKDKVQFKAPCHNYKTDYHCPLGSEDRLIADWSFYPTFEALNIEDILNIYCWLLLERQVLVISKHLGNVTSLIFSFIPLLKPFVWQCCFIPVLPESLIESIDAPFPFIIGHNKMPDQDTIAKREYLIVDIDTKKLLYPPNIVQPKLPGKKKLETTLTAHKKEMNDLRDQIPIDHLKHRFTQNIINTFREYQTWLVDQISSGVLTCINNLYIQKQNENNQNKLDINNNNNNNNDNQQQQDINNNEDNKINNSEDNKINNDSNNENINNDSINNNEQKQNNINENNDQENEKVEENQTSSLSSSQQKYHQQQQQQTPILNNENYTIDALTSIELLNKQSIHFLENQKNIKDIVECLPKKYQDFFKEFFQTQIFTVNAVKLMLSIQERHKTSISLIEKLESLILMEEKSKEVLMEYQKMAKKDAKVDMNTIKKQLKDSEGVINELKESKKKLEMEALATSPSKANLSGISSLFSGLSSISELRKKKLEFGHRRSRSVTDQVEKNILKKSTKAPLFSFFDMSGSKGSANSGGPSLNSSSSNLATHITNQPQKTSPPISINRTNSNLSDSNNVGNESQSPKSFGSSLGTGSSMPSSPLNGTPISSPILSPQSMNNSPRS
ncbi:hypothetical protein DICPUDRAFT_151514 [Dictyostelium purpureum]|uniref:UDENN domain-containing protein n=1 Tax=Dictyostelium purpureum TaxID=5786 RepID=F0ZJ17_DICPU|nr:uncharacterized protein DICPUDRAFT_151514 [Dictyostelium purpureum]EGC36035.1 hypothetical protein DICPUDRAFT_151514 [Dictyostelium purpureum]|eukprot:XP_003287410.1 hypothetical protein DICPUDRAFT_151514 [Dictyostelium purpureum]